ncbi:MAG TPA: helix-turn-helix domain-containing protein [Anaerolineales bacterium]|nr:helix-turn-helix domain-containing protein [Anaerolineales bacterium]
MNERSFRKGSACMTDETVTKGERTRAEILAATYKLFIARGFHGTSMRQIAREAGIALGGIYNHFSSKDDIFLAVLLERHPYFHVIPVLKTAQGETVEELVQDAARRMVALLGGERTDFLNLMFIELVEFRGQHVPQLFTIMFPEVLAFAQRFVTGKDELRSIPLPVVVRAFIGLFFSYIITDILLGKQMPPEMEQNALDYFIDIYLHGILKD